MLYYIYRYSITTGSQKSPPNSNLNHLGTVDKVGAEPWKQMETTPLHLAAKFRNVQFALDLLAAGADIEARQDLLL